MKELNHKDFTLKELEIGYDFMRSQIEIAPQKYRFNLLTQLNYYWKLFLSGEFTVDGATFVEQQNENFFNIWWFNHDGRNHEGYVGRNVDNEMLSIMTLVNVPPKHFMQVVPLLYLTKINVIRHKLRGSYKGDNPPNLIMIN